MVETRCNGPVPGWNRTRNRTGNLDPLLTLHAAEEQEEGKKLATLGRSHTPTFKDSDSDNAITQLEWGEEEPYMMSTNAGKKRNKGKGRIGVEQPQTSE